MTEVATPTIQKQQFRNDSGGWLGVVIIGPKGDETGASVEPGGTVWLSEPEKILTANAPRRPEDNPFIEQTVQRRDPETDALVDVKVTPLVPISENRYVPASARPVPPSTSVAADTALAEAAARAEEPTVPTTLEAGALERHAEVEAIGPDAQPHQEPPVPRMAAKAAAAQAITEPPSPDLSEIDGAPPASDPTPPAPPAPPATPPGATEPPASAPGAETPPEAPGAPENAGEPPQAAEEEHAGLVNPAVGEETGRAESPAGPAPEGEYQAQEEVGTPTAPATPPVPPAPFSPPEG